MDLGEGPSFRLQTWPRGTVVLLQQASKFGAIVSLGANMSRKGHELREDVVYAGLNEAGLSCDLHALLNSSYPLPSNSSRDLHLHYFCNWALSNFGTAKEVKAGLLEGAVHLWGVGGAAGVHFIVRDRMGQGVVVEFMERTTKVYEDNNDNGQTGYGVFTNEPEYPWHIANVKHYLWKQSLARPATALPGAFYPDERFLRIHLIKSSMPKPSSYQEAMEQALHVLNTVTVPMGQQMGTDSGFGEGLADHTHWGHVYDHKAAVLYWRTQGNLQLQRVELTDALVGMKAVPKSLAYVNTLPWYNDATHAFGNAATVLTPTFL